MQKGYLPFYSPYLPLVLRTFSSAAAVLDNLPKVPHEKYDKLAGVVRKVISQVGVSIRGGAEGFHMPQGNDEQKMSKGYAFVESNTPEVCSPP